MCAAFFPHIKKANDNKFPGVIATFMNSDDSRAKLNPKRPKLSL